MATLSPNKREPSPPLPTSPGQVIRAAQESRRAGEGRAINLCPAFAAGELT